MPDLIPARLRIQSYAVWEVAVFVLNVLAFILIGLQLKPILARLTRQRARAVRRGGGRVCVAVILVRIVWVHDLRGDGEIARTSGSATGEAGGRRLVRHARHRDAGRRARAAGRGAGAAFPYRDLILFTAFCVVLGTLVVQGMTVRPLMRLLRLEDDGSVDREVRIARAETARAGLAVVDGAGDSEILAFLRRKYVARVRRVEQDGGAQDDPEVEGWRDFSVVLQRAQAAERRTLSDLRARGVIGDDAFHLVEEELDWSEANTQARQSEPRAGVE